MQAFNFELRVSFFATFFLLKLSHFSIVNLMLNIFLFNTFFDKSSIFSEKTMKNCLGAHLTIF